MMFAQARERAAWARVGWRRRCTVRRSWTWRALTCATVTGRWRWRRWPSSARHVTDHAPPHPCSTAHASPAQRSTAQLSSCVYSCSGCRIASSHDSNRVTVQITYGIPCRMVPDLMAESEVPTYPPCAVLCCGEKVDGGVASTAEEAAMLATGWCVCLAAGPSAEARTWFQE
jgi:hypothetical protein